MRVNDYILAECSVNMKGTCEVKATQQSCCWTCQQKNGPPLPQAHVTYMLLHSYFIVTSVDFQVVVLATLSRFLYSGNIPLQWRSHSCPGTGRGTHTVLRNVWKVKARFFRGVWGHAPQEKMWNLGPPRSHLPGFSGQVSSENNTHLQYSGSALVAIRYSAFDRVLTLSRAALI